MWPLDVSIYGGRCLLTSSVVKLVHSAKWPFLIACIRVCLTGLNSVAWYHCDSSVLVLSTIGLLYGWCVGMGIRCEVGVRFN